MEKLMGGRVLGFNFTVPVDDNSHKFQGVFGEAAAFNYWCRDANVSKQSENKSFSKANVWV